MQQTDLMQTDIVQIVTTTGEKSDATRIASALVAERLAACVQVDGPIDSHYRWRGAIETAVEWRLTIKTSAAIADRVVEWIRGNHPYDEPEILVVPIVGGSDSYCRWVCEQVRPAPDE